MILSILIPCYNEENTILKVLETISQVPLDQMNVKTEIIVVDDRSTDSTWRILHEAQKKYPIKLLHHDRNSGKGSAIRTALSSVTGDVVLIQDADMEYDPNDYPSILKAFIENKADVVYGSRFLRNSHPKGMKPLFYLGNRWFTFLANSLYGAGITDEATCYKAFRAPILKSMNLECRGFEFCPEVTAKAVLQGLRIHEVPVSYFGRTAQAGKKISWKDAVITTYTLFRYRLKSLLGWKPN